MGCGNQESRGRPREALAGRGELGGRQEQVEPAVVVEVEEGRAPAHQVPLLRPHAGDLGVVLETVPEVLQERHGHAHVGEVEVEIEVVVVVADRQPHAVPDGAGPRLAGGVRPAPAAAARPVVAPQHVADGVHDLVVHHVDVGVAVVVVVGEARREAGSAQLFAEQARDVLEGAVAKVAVEPVAREGGVWGLAPGKAGPVGDEQVEVPVAVVVCPGGGAAPAGVAHPGGLGDVAEALADLVAEQDVGAVGEDVEVLEAVVVVVCPDRAAGPGVGQGDVGGVLREREGAVAVVAVELAGDEAAGGEEVDEAVVVVVAPGLPDAEIA